MSRRSIIIGAAATLAVLLIWYFLLWSPQGKAIDTAKRRQQAAADQVDELQARLNQLRDAQRNETATRAQIAQLQEAIPDEPNLAQFILDTNDAANRSGIDFLSISPTPPATPPASTDASGQPVAGGPSQINLGLSITGGYFQVIDFMNRLTDLSRIVVIDGINVSGSASGDLTVTLTARMFTNQGPAVAGGDPSASTTTTTAPGAPGATTTTVAGAAPTTAVPG